VCNSTNCHCPRRYASAGDYANLRQSFELSPSMSANVVGRHFLSGHNGMCTNFKLNLARVNVCPLEREREAGIRELIARSHRL
jgi:hypothetical protein